MVYTSDGGYRVIPSSMVVPTQPQSVQYYQQYQQTSPCMLKHVTEAEEAKKVKQQPVVQPQPVKVYQHQQSTVHEQRPYGISIHFLTLLCLNKTHEKF